MGYQWQALIVFVDRYRMSMSMIFIPISLRCTNHIDLAKLLEILIVHHNNRLVLLLLLVRWPIPLEHIVTVLSSWSSWALLGSAVCVVVAKHVASVD